MDIIIVLVIALLMYITYSVIMRENSVNVESKGWSHSKDTLEYLSMIKKGKKNGSFIYTIKWNDGTIHYATSMRKYCRDFGLHQPSMVSLGNNKIDNYKGFEITKKSI